MSALDEKLTEALSQARPMNVPYSGPWQLVGKDGIVLARVWEPGPEMDHMVCLAIRCALAATTHEGDSDADPFVSWATSWLDGSDQTVATVETTRQHLMGQHSWDGPRYNVLCCAAAAARAYRYIADGSPSCSPVLAAANASVFALVVLTQAIMEGVDVDSIAKELSDG